MTNPNDAVGTNAAYGGRTSVNAFNDNLSAFSNGVVSGWACVPNSGLTVSLGGDGTNRDVAIAEDNTGNKTTINNISGSPIDITIPTAPASLQRYDLIVAYVDNPPQGVTTTADNPAACGIIPVKGTPSSTPVAPDDNTIRTAITADGASGVTAYYVVLAEIHLLPGLSTITSQYIHPGAVAQGLVPPSANSVSTDSIQDSSITANKIDYSSLEVYTDIKSGNSIGSTYADYFTYTIVTTGKYFIAVNCNLQSANSSHTSYVDIRKNGTAIDTSYQTIETASFGNLTIAGGYPFTTGDIVTIALRDTVGLSASTNTKLRFAIVRIN